mgnify:CR=1 FL=1
MQLENSFVVPADIETAWQTLLDVEAVAPCMPGATLTSFEGDEFTAAVKVKLGPVTMTYNGQGRFVSKDEENHTLVIEGSGKDSRGGGTAKGQVTAVLVAEAPDQAAALAEPGRDYVLDHYTWPATLDRMALGLEDMA